MENRIEIFSYYKVWKIERKIYSIGNFHLPTPINPYDLMSFAGVLLAIQILSKILPFILILSAPVRYILLPVLIGRYLNKKKLDGKNPISYVIGIVIYFVTSFGTYVELFERYRDTEKVMIHNWKSSRGRYKNTCQRLSVQ